MKFNFSILIIALVAILFTPAFAADRALAEGLAAAAAAQASKGNLEMAKDFCFKALVNDEDCPEAVYELARVFDKENNLSAADFYQRAIVLFNKEGKTQAAAKRSDAEKRVKALNPFAPRYASAFEEYATELDRIVKRAPESAVKDAALTRAQELDLSGILPGDKMPKFFAAAAAEKSKAPGEKSTSPEVERELKALGWTTVKGEFIKKSSGVYESTEGRLEATKLNGAIEFTVLKNGGEGEVIGTVRSDHKVDRDSSRDREGEGERRRGPPGFGRRNSKVEGYGVLYRPGEYKEYGVDEGGRSFFGPTKGPYEVDSHTLPDGAAKNVFLVQIAEGSLEITANGKRGYKVNSGRISKGGPFVLEINGTVTIENPRCTGQ